MAWSRGWDRRARWGGLADEASGGARIVVRELAAGEWLAAGKPAYGVGAGWWLGVDHDGVARFDFGAAGGDYIRWDGAAVQVSGELTFRAPTAVAMSRALKWAGVDGVTAYVGAAYAAHASTLRLWADALTPGRDALVEIGAGAPAGQAASVRVYAAGDAAAEIEVSQSAATGGVIKLAAAAVNVGGGLAVGDTSTVAAAGNVELTGVIKIDGHAVLGPPQAGPAALSDTSGAANDGACRAALNSLLAGLRAHGLIG